MTSRILLTLLLAWLICSPHPAAAPVFALIGGK